MSDLHKDPYQESFDKLLPFLYEPVGNLSKKGLANLKVHTIKIRDVIGDLQKRIDREEQRKKLIKELEGLHHQTSLLKINRNTVTADIKIRNQKLKDATAAAKEARARIDDDFEELKSLEAQLDVFATRIATIEGILGSGISSEPALKAFPESGPLPDPPGGTGAGSESSVGLGASPPRSPDYLVNRGPKYRRTIKREATDALGAPGKRPMLAKQEDARPESPELRVP